MYMTLEGIFGAAIDVSSSLIILFTIFGAFLQYSHAGKFFIDFSFSAMGGKPTGAGRTVVLASFLLGGPSGSGVATTVTLGSVAYPMLAKVGYEKNAAGGLLAAGGLGAIISPPVLGAAAFLIAEFLKISYLDVLLMAVIPTILFYLALFLMVEIDARKYGMRDVTFEKVAGVWALTREYWFHFVSLVSIIVFMLLGFSPVLSVFWATVLSFLTSFLHRDCALVPRNLFRDPRGPFKAFMSSGLMRAMEGGSVGMLNVGTTCAGAGLIVGVVTLTGLGLKFSSIILEYAGGSLMLTAIYTALIVWIVGLAVPVTASYIICAVIAAPALIKLGVPDYAAHMFIFYYAVLSEVSPPTALSPFAAAAITGGDPYKTTLQSWKYTMPAFLVPFVFVLDPAGQGLLLMGSVKALAGADWGSIAIVSLTAAAGIVALAGGFQGWLIERTSRLERLMLLAAGLLLVYPKAWAAQEARMSASLNAKIAEVFDEPGCDINQGKIREGAQEGLHQAADPGAAAGGCAFDGAKIALQPIVDVAHLVHGPIACEGNGWDNRHSASSGPQTYRTGYTTDINEFDVIYGGEKRLFKAIREVIDKTDPPAVFVYQTCVTAMIGDDIEAVCKRASEKFGKPVIPIDAPGFAGPRTWATSWAPRRCWTT
jgi:TRAP transporter 4TM/12TM fusion protein